ncbi:aminodeoxychorismate synthase component I [Denitromonas iodatirespirans]|uniref:Aminodeoxychorismate synthase component I n=1 Tax=Denitromonas iodatirespirans TaxID=2795389 RepID=A0A944H7V1_DENI1|nr:aminodeoxychorismate synthase component I [Denitromonas iodatirespirans]MBT0961569.1 aminodeoxychorismate synthase component I [Denitromonas iodatirespirans]
MLPFATRDPVALFDDNLVDQHARHLHGLVDTICCDSPDTLDAAFARIEAATATGHWVALAAAYELGYALEARLAPLRPASATPLLRAWIFTHGELIDDAGCEQWLAAQDDGRATGLMDLSADLHVADYLTAVGRIKQYIRNGDCYQTNFTFGSHGRAYGQPARLYRKLREAQPVRYGALILHADGCLMSRSPELFVARRGETLTCKPMKGTAPIDASPAALTASDKNRAENLMIVDLLRNDLGRLAPPGGVAVPALFEAEAYRTVWQMTSTITASPVRASLAEIFRALFPCGSVTGAPKIRAMQIIRELEHGPRGVYCGALGWIAPGGDFQFNVPIRTLDIAADGALRCHTGSGIVEDSVASDEWAECRLKLAFLNRMPGDLRLIETLRFDGNTLPWRDDHLARLARSAAALGMACDPDAVRAALDRATAPLNGEHRVRLTLGHAGDIDITTAALTPLVGPQTVCLADEPLDSTDPLLPHKTTERAIYERQLAAAMARGHFDALFFNEHGQLAEGARSSVFVELDGNVFTPPLSAGLLDGICRRRALREGFARERPLTHDDLARASRLWVGNALRGLIEVTLAD